MAKLSGRPGQRQFLSDRPVGSDDVTRKERHRRKFSLSCIECSLLTGSQWVNGSASLSKVVSRFDFQYKPRGGVILDKRSFVHVPDLYIGYTCESSGIGVVQSWVGQGHNKLFSVWNCLTGTPGRIEATRPMSRTEKWCSRGYWYVVLTCLVKMLSNVP